MSRRQMHDAPERALPTLSAAAASASAGTATATNNIDRTNDPDRNPVDAAPDPTAPDPSAHDGDDAALLPSPGATAGAVLAGGALGFATVYSLAARHVDPLLGVAVIVGLFAIAVLGLKSLTDARTESGRAVAVGLNALATGAGLGGLTVLL